VNATEGIIIAGGNGNGSQTDQLNIPGGIIVDENETIYVVDEHNHRVEYLSAGTRNGIVIAGGHGPGNASNQLHFPGTLAFNGQGDWYVSDADNSRVQMFAMDKSSSITTSTITTTTTTTTTITNTTTTSGSHSDYIDNYLSIWTLIYCFLSLMISVAI
jgi:hypothetical protein